MIDLVSGDCWAGGSPTGVGWRAGEESLRETVDRRRTIGGRLRMTRFRFRSAALRQLRRGIPRIRHDSSLVPSDNPEILVG